MCSRVVVAQPVSAASTGPLAVVPGEPRPAAQADHTTASARSAATRKIDFISHLTRRRPGRLTTMEAGSGRRDGAAACGTEFPAELQLRAARETVHNREVLTAMRAEGDAPARRQRAV